MSSSYWLIVALAALVPLVIGALWYSKLLFGNTWMRVNRFRDEDMKGANMALTFGLTYVFSFMMAITLSSIVIHQMSLFSLIADNPNDPSAKAWMESSLQTYGNKFRTFKHGMLHGGIAATFIGLPIIAILAMFERRGWKYILIHWGYWFITMMLMGGILCQFISFKS